MVQFLLIQSNLIHGWIQSMSNSGLYQQNHLHMLNASRYNRMQTDSIIDWFVVRARRSAFEKSQCQISRQRRPTRSNCSVKIRNFDARQRLHHGRSDVHGRPSSDRTFRAGAFRLGRTQFFWKRDPNSAPGTARSWAGHGGRSRGGRDNGGRGRGRRSYGGFD